MPRPPIATLQVIAIQEYRDIVPMHHRQENGLDAPDEMAHGMTDYQAFLRGPSGKLYVVKVPPELGLELQQLTVKTNPEDDQAIEALFQMRSSATDRYGDDLVGLLMAEFSSDPNLSHHNRLEVPPEHQQGLMAFRALSYEEQDRLVEAYAARP